MISIFFFYLFYTLAEGRRHCLIDMFMVGVRRLNGLSVPDRLEFIENLRSYNLRNNDGRMQQQEGLNESFSEKILFTEMYIRFHKEYIPSRDNDWNISYFKVATFKILSMK